MVATCSFGPSRCIFRDSKRVPKDPFVNVVDVHFTAVIVELSVCRAFVLLRGDFGSRLVSHAVLPVNHIGEIVCGMRINAVRTTHPHRTILVFVGRRERVNDAEQCSVVFKTLASKCACCAGVVGKYFELLLRSAELRALLTSAFLLSVWFRDVRADIARVIRQTSWAESRQWRRLMLALCENAKWMTGRFLSKTIITSDMSSRLYLCFDSFSVNENFRWKCLRGDSVICSRRKQNYSRVVLSRRNWRVNNPSNTKMISSQFSNHINISGMLRSLRRTVPAVTGYNVKSGSCFLTQFKLLKTDHAC